MSGPRDWYAWHAAYDQPGSDLQQRLGVVQQQVAAALSRAPTGRIRVVSACAGQGRELLPVLGCHPRRPDVSARLIELDARNAAAARAHAAAVGAIEADAKLTPAERAARRAAADRELEQSRAAAARRWEERRAGVLGRK